MHNTHVQVDRDPDPFSFNARVNATRIAISILVGSRSHIFLFRVNRVYITQMIHLMN